MATTERTAEANPPAAVAANCRNAGLVRLVAAPRGDALAALGLLAGALEDCAVPFHATIGHFDDQSAADADATVVLGDRSAGSAHGLDGPTDAYAVAAELSRPDPVLGLVAAVARGVEPPAAATEDAKAAGIARRPGLAVPTADPVDGLAHSTLIHGSFSGDTDTASGVLGDEAGNATDDARRSLASAVVLAVATESPPGGRSGRALERVLRPYESGPFDTVGGYADVLDALGRRAPGLGLAVVLGDPDTEVALDVWRDHALAVHGAVTTADLQRYDGLAVATVDADPAAVGVVARLLRDFRSPEPTVLASTSDRVALATGAGRDARGLLADQVDDTGVTGHETLASAPATTGDVEMALRDVLGGGA